VESGQPISAVGAPKMERATEALVEVEDSVQNDLEESSRSERAGTIILRQS